MSIHAIKTCQTDIENIIHYGCRGKEMSIRNAFQQLLNEYGKQKGLLLIPEISLKTKDGKTVTPDGTLKDSLRQDWGYLIQVISFLHAHPHYRRPMLVKHRGIAILEQDIVVRVAAARALSLPASVPYTI